MSKKKPVIGIPGWKIGDNSFGCGVNHLDFISKFGDPRILFPQDNDADIDLLYLPGGPDINPSAYGQIPGFYTSNQDVFRQYFFDNNLKKYIERGIPVFGICLGFQMLNVYFGGTITQDMKYHVQSKDRWLEGHDVHMYGVKRTKDTKFPVNSHHHQAVLFTDLSKDLVPVFYADNEEDSNNCIIEAFRHTSLPIAGVQWHPEEWRDEYAISEINRLLGLE